MAFAYFSNQAAWTAYHDAACAAEQIPRPGRIQATQEPAILNQWTNAYSDPVQVKGTGNVTAWVSHIPDADIARFGISLWVADSAVTFNEDGTISFTYAGKTYTSEPEPGFNWRKPKPPTYEMDGVTYDTATGLPV